MSIIIKEPELIRILDELQEINDLLSGSLSLSAEETHLRIIELHKRVNAAVHLAETSITPMPPVYTSVSGEEYRTAAQKELADEQFREAVEAEKHRLRTQRPWWQKFFPYEISLTIKRR